MTNISIGFVGLGQMGTGMARNLQKWLRTENRPLNANPSVLLYNRTVEKAQHLAAEPDMQSSVAASLEDLGAQCHLVFAMLSNDEAACSCFEGFCNGFRADTSDLPRYYIDCSTLLPTTSTKLAEMGESVAGVIYLACPVFGRPDAAAAAKLTAVLATTIDSEVPLLEPYIKSFSSRMIRLHGPPSMATSMKLAGNFFIVSQIELISECMTLAEAAGVPHDTYLDLLNAFFTGPIPTGYASRIANDDFGSGAGFTVDLALKDVGHMRTLASTSNCPAPLADLAYQHLLTVRSQGGAHLDWSAIALAVRQAAGLPTPQLQQKQ